VSDPRLRVGVVGYGLAGATFHAPLIRTVDRLILSAVATTRAGGGPAGVERYADAEALIAAPDIDLVVIATPNDTHFPLARSALLAGKHVVVDKPFTVTVAEADDLIALAATSGRVLSVFHNRRWDGDFLTVRKIVEARLLGEIMLFEAHWDRFRPGIKQGWREVAGQGAGLLNDLGPHLIDQALQLFGPPEAIQADIAVQRAGARVDDYFDIVLRHGAMRAVLGASTLAATPRARFAIYGTRGSFVKHGLDPQETQLGSGGCPGNEGFGREAEPFFGTLVDETGRSERIATERGRYADFYERLADAISNGAAPPVDPADARDGVALIALARRSAKEGRVLRR
jgi:scyllo-inositol 2-dehydrogenase (NADP+)